VSGIARCAGAAAGAAADGRMPMCTNVLLPGRGAAANGFCGSLSPGFCGCALAGLEAWTVPGFEGWTVAGLVGGATDRIRARAKAGSLASTIAQPNIRTAAILDTGTSLGSEPVKLSLVDIGFAP
jgi:hypothetical protein